MKLVAPLNLNFLLKYFFLAFVLCFNDCLAKGDLTRQKPLEVEILFKGKVGESHFTTLQCLSLKQVNCIN